MDGLEKARIKNQIIEYLLNHSGAWAVDSLFEHYGKPFKSLSHFQELVLEMIEEAPKYFGYDLDDGWVNYVSANDFTSEFSEWGGFVDLYVAQQWKHKELEEQGELEERYRQLERDNLVLVHKLNKQKLKTHWIPIGISILGLALSLYAVIRSSPVPQERRNEPGGMDDTMKVQDYMGTKENDSLKLELYRMNKQRDTLR